MGFVLRDVSSMCRTWTPSFCFTGEPPQQWLVDINARLNQGFHMGPTPKWVGSFASLYFSLVSRSVLFVSPLEPAEGELPHTDMPIC